MSNAFSIAKLFFLVCLWGWKIKGKIFFSLLLIAFRVQNAEKKVVVAMQGEVNEEEKQAKESLFINYKHFNLFFVINFI
jgi:hypothetical protein